MTLATATEAAPSTPPVTYGLMRLGERLLGIGIDRLAEVCPIPALLPLMQDAPGLRGGLDLRGQLVPILDPSVICGGAPASCVPKFAAILREGNRLLGIGIDEIVGLTEAAPRDMQRLSGVCAPSDTMIAGAILNDGRLVSVLDVGAVFAQPQVPSVAAAGVAALSADHRGRRTTLTFRAGGAHFSLPAVEVYGTVPRQPVETGPLSQGHCLGTIVYHRQRIPVIESTGFIGLGRRVPAQAYETVILRFPGQGLLGFAVDAILDIEAVLDTAFLPATAAVAALAPAIASLRVRPDGTQVFELDVAWLRAHPNLVAHAAMTMTEGEPEAAPQADALPPAAPRDAAARVAESTRYLIFAANGVRATPLTQVACILPPPTGLVPVGSGAAGLVGLFTHNGRVVPLARLAAATGADDDGRARVLLVDTAQGPVGLLVERVLSIDASVWRHTAQGPDGAPQVTIQIGQGAAARVLPMTDLTEIAARYAGSALRMAG